MPNTNPLLYRAALEDFRRLKRQAALRQVVSRLTGHSSELLAYGDVETYLQPTAQIEHGLQEIPVAAIVGSVGRYQDFTRDFLPKRDSDAERWARVKSAILDARPMPPIEVYKVGGVYFVKDGNHRVSVARQLGTETLTAYVTEVKTRVPLTPQDDPTQVICKARYTEFLSETNLDKLRPDADLLMTYCGEYETFLRQIATHHGWLQLKCQCLMSADEAVADWYDRVYTPVVKMIRKGGVLRHFPDCTEADLYILLLRRREELNELLGWQVDTETAVASLAIPTRSIGQRLWDVVVPEELEDGPTPGQWRQRRLTPRGVADQRGETLFRAILTPVRGSHADWQMLDSAIELAQRENGRLLGLHVVKNKAETGSVLAQKVEASFVKRCRAAGVPYDFAIDVGSITDTIIRRAAWTDLVLVPLPAASAQRTQVGAHMAALVQRSPCPIWALPAARSAMDHALLAYDGSPKAEEALFVATYLALRWQIALTVITVETAYTPATAVDRARAYLEEHEVNAEFVLRAGDIAAAIRETAVARQTNLLIMGGFGYRAMLHRFLGSTVDNILRNFPQPTLICR
ncbi:MAG: universal stress protein [Ardenticatenaceae bacterium]|nr:universal stress protein [Ardenticatenaceae bacterium]